MPSQSSGYVAMAAPAIGQMWSSGGSYLYTLGTFSFSKLRRITDSVLVLRLLSLPFDV
jgi:hypothetical protein